MSELKNVRKDRQSTSSDPTPTNTRSDDRPFVFAIASRRAVQAGSGYFRRPALLCRKARRIQCRLARPRVFQAGSSHPLPRYAIPRGGHGWKTRAPHLFLLPAEDLSRTGNLPEGCGEALPAGYILFRRAVTAILRAAYSTGLSSAGEFIMAVRTASAALRIWFCCSVFMPSGTFPFAGRHR